MSQINTVWKINGFEFDVNLQDADFAEHYETAFERMAEEEKKMPKEGKLSKLLLAECMLYRHLFDDLFGDGTSNALFGEKNDRGVMQDVYENFLTFVADQSMKAQERTMGIIQKFGPNRAQRRNK